MQLCFLFRLQTTAKLKPKLLNFKPYSREELLQILQGRVQVKADILIFLESFTIADVTIITAIDYLSVPTCGPYLDDFILWPILMICTVYFINGVTLTNTVFALFYSLKYLHNPLSLVAN